MFSVWHILLQEVLASGWRSSHVEKTYTMWRCNSKVIRMDAEAMVEELRLKYSDEDQEWCWPKGEKDYLCDGTSQVIRPTYSCPCPMDLRQPQVLLNHLTSLVSTFLTFPKSVSPVTQTLQASEIRKCGSSYINLPLFKSKTELNIYRPEYNICVQSIIIITNHGRQKPLLISSHKSFMVDPFLLQLHSWCSSFGTTLEQKQQKLVASSPKNNMGQSPEYGIT
jgi:hypothetical protein